VTLLDRVLFGDDPVDPDNGVEEALAAVPPKVGCLSLLAAAVIAGVLIAGVLWVVVR
jgi:hypothetical protein